MKRKLSLVLLLLMIGASLVTGTYAVYTKSFPFVGTITKVSSETPPAPGDEDIIFNPGNNGVTEKDDGAVSIKNRGDILFLKDLPGNDYKIDVDIANFKALNAFGIYVDGYYNETDKKIYADVIQFVSGHIEVKRRPFIRSFDNKGNIIVTEDNEGTYGLIASETDVASVYTASGNKNSMHLTVIMKTKIGKSGTLVVVPEVYINDILVPNQTYPERELLHAGNQAYLGYRSWWGGSPDVIFKNLTITPLETISPVVPDVIIPDTGSGTGSNPDITVNPDGNEVTIKNSGDYVFAQTGITDSNYVVKTKLKLSDNAPDGLEQQLKGVGLFIDGKALSNGAVNADCLYFTNSGGTEQMNLGTVSLVPAKVGNSTIFNRVNLNDDVKVTTQGELNLEWNEFKSGFYLYAAVKGDPLTGRKQVRVFVSDANDSNLREVGAYYDSPWTGLPPFRDLYKTNDRIYVGYHANNGDGRNVEFSQFSVSNGFSSIPSELLSKYEW